MNATNANPAKALEVAPARLKKALAQRLQSRRQPQYKGIAKAARATVCSPCCPLPAREGSHT